MSGRWVKAKPEGVRWLAAAFTNVSVVSTNDVLKKGKKLSEQKPEVVDVIKDEACSEPVAQRLKYSLPIDTNGDRKPDQDFVVIITKSNVGATKAIGACFRAKHSIYFARVEQKGNNKSTAFSMPIPEVDALGNPTPPPLLGNEVVIGDFLGNDNIDDLAIQNVNGAFDVYTWDESAPSPDF